MKKIVEWLLKFPYIYSITMRLFVRKNQRDFLIDFIEFSGESKVLDIGCGPASILNKTGTDISYTGIDSNPRYVSLATQRFGEFARFLLIDVDDLASQFTEKFNKILILGTLHHLSAAEVRKVLKVAHGLLSDDGVLITHDPVRSPNQHFISKLLMNLDRGKFIRCRSEHLAFFNADFMTTVTVKKDLLRFPYEIIYVKAKPIVKI